MLTSSYPLDGFVLLLLVKIKDYLLILKFSVSSPLSLMSMFFNHVKQNIILVCLSQFYNPSVAEDNRNASKQPHKMCKIMCWVCSIKLPLVTCSTKQFKFCRVSKD